ncbi:hypothetical protein FOXG_05346 [Fusarium oxysporum f. sp. lycopersici 4287]|uniref:RanBD1 domain-containing protein n=1 Tax=Fusarium oxysporum f. sp. lycopersici (strain 4287 / CBS 123668 / FGSC 9935 / NRRL 34936) TaxID=426428 RepID=A0A0J9UT92_FUSO4|nr:hypothetical protein FOXG_05346 [Fusarium oxysporum f. sp. lycopersici 4287]KNB02490.1 hypothetical protein FOXG_05346 [Fusarium oxysporum f. sp. lycopersici 4287]
MTRSRKRQLLHQFLLQLLPWARTNAGLPSAMRLIANPRRCRRALLLPPNLSSRRLPTSRLLLPPLPSSLLPNPLMMGLLLSQIPLLSTSPTVVVVRLLAASFRTLSPAVLLALLLVETSLATFLMQARPRIVVLMLMPRVRPTQMLRMIARQPVTATSQVRQPVAPTLLLRLASVCSDRSLPLPVASPLGPEHLVLGRAPLAEVCLTELPRIMMDSRCVLERRMRQQPRNLSTRPGTPAPPLSNLRHLALHPQAKLPLCLERPLRRRRVLCSPRSLPLLTYSVPPSRTSLRKKNQHQSRSRLTRREVNPTKRTMRPPRSHCSSLRLQRLRQTLGLSLPPKPATEPSKAGEPTKPATSLFGTKSDDKSNTPPPTTNLFGAVSKPAESSGPSMQSSTLFGAKPATNDAAKTSLFGAPSAESTTATSLFGAKPTSTATNLFGNAAVSTAKPLFGAPNSGDATAPKTDAAPTADKPAAAPIFSFGAPSAGADKINGANKPLFGAPQSPTSSGAAALDGSPMKQDGPSPAKKAFDGGSTGASAAPIFSFGGASTAPAAPSFGGGSGTSTPLFGGASTTPAANNAGSSFGANSTNSGGSFGFQFGGNSASSSFNNPFSSGNDGGNTASTPSSAPGGMFSFGATTAPSGGSNPFQFGGASNATSTPAFGAGSNNNAPAFGGASGSTGAPGFSFTGASPAQNSAPTFGSNQNGNLQPPAGGSTTGTNTPFSLGGGSSLATTPAGGTPEPSNQAEGAAGGDEEGEKHEQVNLAENLEQDEDIMHDVRAKVLKFVPASEKSDDKKPKSQSPWSVQGVGALRLLKHKETSVVRLLLRAEPRGHIAMNRAVLADMSYKADKKYVKMTTSNEKGDGLETWMIQVKTADMAKELAEALEQNKVHNKK